MSDWIEWSGGECPLPDGTMVDVEYRDGEIAQKLPANVIDHRRGRDACKSFWIADGLPNDIVAYRVLGPAPLTLAEVTAQRDKLLDALKEMYHAFNWGDMNQGETWAIEQCRAAIAECERK